MTTSGLLKLSAVCIVLLLAGVGYFAFDSFYKTGTRHQAPGIRHQALGKRDQTDNDRFNQVALFLAGITDSKKTGNFPQTEMKEWKSYAKGADSNWAKFYKRKLDPVRTWEIKEVPRDLDTIKTLFYPFSGPDFIFANAFFPDASTYILFGLESPGNVPDPASWTEKELKSSLAALNKSLDDVTSIGFFRTNDMKMDLESSSINGVTPLLMLFLARSGHTITDVIPGVLSPEGEFRPVKEFQNEQGGKSYGTAVEIRFTKNANGKKNSLIYFSADISDEGLIKNPGCKNFLRQIPSTCLTFIKSASYLMHMPGFSIIRKTILAKSTFILQDDSGIAYRFFRHSDWDIRLFGTYSRTIDLFKHKYQEDLKEAYDKEEKPRPVPFKIGYNIKFNETNLLMAIRKNNTE